MHSNENNMTYNSHIIYGPSDKHELKSTWCWDHLISKQTLAPTTSTQGPHQMVSDVTNWVPYAQGLAYLALNLILLASLCCKYSVFLQLRWEKCSPLSRPQYEPTYAQLWYCEAQMFLASSHHSPLHWCSKSFIVKITLKLNVVKSRTRISLILLLVFNLIFIKGDWI